MNPLTAKLRKYFVMGSQDCIRDPEETLLEAIQAGITTFQYREKGPNSLSGEAEVELGRKLRKICKDHGVLFIINDKVDLAETLDADGIHVGQGDTPVEKVREQFPDKIIGLSVTSVDEVKKSRIDLVDYVGAGPIYATQTKPGKKPAGLAWLQDIRKLHPELPIVAIGGIKPENADTVLDAGADGLAVVTAISHSDQIKEAVHNL